MLVQPRRAGSVLPSLCPAPRRCPEAAPCPPGGEGKEEEAPGVSPGASQPHRVVLAAGSVRRGRQEMVKALVVARGFVIFLCFSSPKKKKNNRPNAKATPQEGAGCVLGLLLPKPAQKKNWDWSHMGRREEKGPSPGAPSLALHDCREKSPKNPKKKKENPVIKNKSIQSRETGKGLLQKSQM